MTDQQQTPTALRVREAGLDDWRWILGRIEARFRTGDFATGLALVNMVGEAAQAAHRHPDVTLTDADVIVSLSSHDGHGITRRDLDLARQISRHAAELASQADVSGLTQRELGLDTAVGERLAPFYAALLGAQLDRGGPVDSTGQVSTVWWQDPHETRRCPRSPSSSAGTSTCGFPTTRPSIARGPSSTPEATWSATRQHRRTGWSRTPRATAPASAHRPVTDPGVTDHPSPRRQAGQPSQLREHERRCGPPSRRTPTSNTRKV